MVLRPLMRWCAALALVVLAGCATRAPLPTPGADGPEARPPPDLMSLPDALPQLEPIRQGGPNKPYVALGETYVPLPPEAPWREEGLASWYGRKFHGRPTASGELYNMYAMSAAHRTLPIPSYVRVSNPANGRSVIVRVNDRGPFVRGRVIDLSYSAALKLDLLRGVAPVQIERITPEAIRSGAWAPSPPPPREDVTRTDVVATAVPPATAVPATRAVPQVDVGAVSTAMAPAPSASAATAPAPAPPPATAAVASLPSIAPTVAARGFWVQLGAFRERGGALQLQRQVAERVEGLALLTAVFTENALHRVQAGPFTTRDEATRVADRVRERLLLVPLVVERR
jgi:rare lipoprotein A